MLIDFLPYLINNKFHFLLNQYINVNTNLTYPIETLAINSTGYIFAGGYTLDGVYRSINSTTNIIDIENPLLSFSLSQNYPNPFNPGTTISWQSPVGSHQTLKIYDVLGREVATLVNEYRDAGSYEVEFDAKNLSSGVYYYQLKIVEFIQTKKMMVVK